MPDVVSVNKQLNFITVKLCFDVAVSINFKHGHVVVQYLVKYLYKKFYAN